MGLGLIFVYSKADTLLAFLFFENIFSCAIL